MRALLATTSYQDTQGPYHEILELRGGEIVRDRGPLPRKQMPDFAGEFDAFPCGDDAIDQSVLKKSLPKLNFNSKYGFGLDKFDVEFATFEKLPAHFTPRANHTTLAERAFRLLVRDQSYAQGKNFEGYLFV